MLASRASRQSSITDVMFHDTSAAMVQADFQTRDNFDLVVLRVGKATFFFEGTTGLDRIAEMCQLGLEIVKAAKELAENGTS